MTVSGKKEVVKVKLAEEVVDPDDIEMLEDLIVAATNEALRKMEEDFSAVHVQDYRRHGNGRRISVLMDYYSKQISKLIEELSSLPGIGSKSAQRLAFHILNMPEERVERLADTILDARRNIRYCKTCYTLTDAEECPICSNSRTGSFHDYGGRNSPGSGSL